jgi:NAD-dependent dihydropyrimidine dehydrogenase PreA subunit
MHPPVIFDELVCIGCNVCVEVCPMDIFAPNPESCQPPLVVYGDECRYCGACWARCPYRKKYAIKIVVPPAMRVSILRGSELSRLAQ